VQAARDRDRVSTCACIQSDVYSQLPFHETVPCSSKDFQLPSWAFDGQTQRRRPQQVVTTPRGVTGRLASAGQTGRKVPGVSGRQAAVRARRQDCTYDASATNDRRRQRRSVAATV